METSAHRVDSLPGPYVEWDDCHPGYAIMPETAGAQAAEEPQDIDVFSAFANFDSVVLESLSSRSKQQTDLSEHASQRDPKSGAYKVVTEFQAGRSQTCTAGAGHLMTLPDTKPSVVTRVKSLPYDTFSDGELPSPYPDAVQLLMSGQPDPSCGESHAGQDHNLTNKLLEYERPCSQASTTTSSLHRADSFSFQMLCGEPYDMLPPQRLPPDYLKIGMVLLLPACPFAVPALWWGYKAKTHCKNGELVQAWQYSHRAFCCSMMGLVFLVLLLLMFTVAMYLHNEPYPCPLPVIQGNIIRTTTLPRVHVIENLQMTGMSFDNPDWTGISDEVSRNNTLHNILYPEPPAAVSGRPAPQMFSGTLAHKEDK